MRRVIDGKWRIVVWLAVLGFGVTPFCRARPAPDFASGKVRIYYVAADEVEWNYAPDGINKMMGMKFAGYPNVFVEQGPHRHRQSLSQGGVSGIYRRDVQQAEAP